MAHCSVLDRDHNALILNEAVINGGIYKLTRYGEDIFLDAQAVTTKPTTCNRTQNGKICQRWDVFWPHNPKYKPIIATHNNCAGPDGDEKHWCYTTDPNVRWEYCHAECKVLTTTITTTTSTSTPKPVQITRTIKPYRISKCGIQNSDKLTSKMSKYSSQGFCFSCKQSVRRQKRIYYHDDKATSFDFPWFVQVGTEYSLSKTIISCNKLWI